MIKLLKIAIQKKLIRNIDLEFAKLICKKKKNINLLVFTCLSYYSSIGNTYLPINIFQEKKFFPSREKLLTQKIIKKISYIKDWKQELLKDNIIGNGESDTPIVIEKNNIYLYKNWYIEKKIVNFFKNQKNNILNIEDNIINKYIKEISKIPSKQNKIAISLILINKITFIIGGPGTGKTNIIQEIVNIFTKIYDIHYKIKIAAFTGKAKNCIIEKLKNNNNYIIKSKNNTIKITTIHKLLRINTKYNYTYFNKYNKLIADVIIIDETSMVDLLMMNKLLDAISQNTKIIFLGDKNQLPTIENGSILKDICYYANNKYSERISKIIYKMTNYHTIINNHHLNYINDCIYILKKQYRFSKKSEINIFANAIIKKKNDILNKILQNKFHNIIIYNITNTKKYSNMINTIALYYLKYINTINMENNIINMINIFNKYRSLCVMKSTMFGTKKINNNIEDAIIKKIKFKKYRIDNNYWYFGKPIIFNKNNKNLNLYNGDIGITTKNKKNQLQVSFLSTKNHVINIPINILNKKEYDVAWSITIHKSQGSEFQEIAIILPNRFNILLTTELLYTAITRAKKKIQIFTENKILIKTFYNQIIRYNGIKNML
ncbi:exodeoxyribonuclease V subunit alpha [Buchnera aphidicola]|uniref:exodeoxyribonuclease V subunit alpha n=1 Tax=Buchnera aphidicola TaxID=9 RepID=UPI0034648B63